MQMPLGITTFGRLLAQAPRWPQLTPTITVHTIFILLLIFHDSNSNSNTSTNMKPKDGQLGVQDKFTLNQLYEECQKHNTDWGCVAIGENRCLENGRRNCHAILSYHHHLTGADSHIDFRLYTEQMFHNQSFDNKYFAVGFSIGDKMGDDLVIACIRYNDNQTVVVSYNGVYKDVYVNLPLEQPNIYPDFITDIFFSEKDGRSFCAFTIETSVVINEKPPFVNSPVEFNMDRNSYNVLMARGQAISSSRIIKHGPTSRFWTDESVDFHIARNYYIPPDRMQEVFATKVHITLMVISYVGFLPMAMLIARFYKESRQRVRFCYRRIWFIVHLLTTIIPALCILTAVIMIGLYLGSFRKQNYRGKRPPSALKYGVHYFVGLSTIMAYLANLILGVYLSISDTERGLKRIVISFVHWLLGVISYMLAMIQFFIAPYALPDQINKCTAASIIVLVWVVFHLAVYMYLTLILYLRDMRMDKEEKEGKKRASEPLPPPPLPPEISLAPLTSHESVISMAFEEPKEDAKKTFTERARRSPSHGERHTIVRANATPAAKVKVSINTLERGPTAGHTGAGTGNGHGHGGKGHVAPKKGPSRTFTPRHFVSQPSPVKKSSDQKRDSVDDKLGTHVHPRSRQNSNQGSHMPRVSGANSPNLMDRKKSNQIHPEALNQKPKKKWSDNGQLSVIKPTPRSAPVRKLKNPRSKRSSGGTVEAIHQNPRSKKSSTEEAMQNQIHKKPPSKKSSSADEIKDLISHQHPANTHDHDHDHEHYHEEHQQHQHGHSTPRRFSSESSIHKSSVYKKVSGGALSTIEFLRKKKTKSNPFMDIDHFEVIQLATRYEEARDPYRAFRSFPLKMDFFLENPYTVRIEVIMWTFFGIALITSAVLIWSLFPPPDLKRGHCETESGYNLWWKKF